MFNFRSSGYEAPVNFALRDLINPGETVIDVGANIGGLTGVMSRLVGPKGLVVAFEGNTSIVPTLRSNMVASNSYNVWVEDTVVSSIDGYIKFAMIPQFPEGGQIVNDDTMILRHPGSTVTQIYGRSIDSFCSDFSLSPSLIKMDIEGAELAALRGAAENITQCKPKLILEQHLHDGLDCMQLLAELGYDALDLKDYSTVNPKVGITSGSVTDILFYHQDCNVPQYFKSPTLKGIGGSYQIDSSNHTEPQRLAAGRYLVKMDWHFLENVNIQQEIWLNGSPFIQSHGSADWIHKNYRTSSMFLPNGGEISGFIRSLGNQDSIVFHGLEIISIVTKTPFRPSSWF